MILPFTEAQAIGRPWDPPPPAQVINPGAILACWHCPARPKTPPSRAPRHRRHHHDRPGRCGDHRDLAL